jgi:hypothetical protein
MTVKHSGYVADTKKCRGSQDLDMDSLCILVMAPRGDEGMTNGRVFHLGSGWKLPTLVETLPNMSLRVENSWDISSWFSVFVQITTIYAGDSWDILRY